MENYSDEPGFLGINKREQEFLSYLEHTQDFSDEEKEQIYESLDRTEIKKIVKTSLMLATWSAVMSVIDTTIFSGTSIAALLQGTVDLVTFLPVMTVWVLNYSSKATFIKLRHNSFSLFQTLKFALPVIGWGLMLHHTLKGEPMLRTALVEFFAQTNFTREKVQWFLQIMDSSSDTVKQAVSSAANDVKQALRIATTQSQRGAS